jgi:hypothetical protein
VHQEQPEKQANKQEELPEASEIDILIAEKGLLRTSDSLEKIDMQSAHEESGLRAACL